MQDARIDPATRRVWRGEREVRPAPKEFDLLHALIAKAGTVINREDLMREVWDVSFCRSWKTIDVHLGWVRRNLGDDTRHPILITTIRGQGLRFETGGAARTKPAETPPAGHNRKPAGRRRPHL